MSPEPGLAERYRVPVPADLEIPPQSLSPWTGGETEGLRRLEQHLTDQVSPDCTWVMLVAAGGLGLVSPSLPLRVVVSGPREAARPWSPGPAWLSSSPPGLSSWQPGLALLLAACKQMFSCSQFCEVDKIFSAVLLG